MSKRISLLVKIQGIETTEPIIDYYEKFLSPIEHLPTSPDNFN